MNKLTGGSMGSIIEAWINNVSAVKLSIAYQHYLREKNTVLKNVFTFIGKFLFGIRVLKEYIYLQKLNLRKVLDTLLRLNSKKDMIGRAITLDMMVYTIGLKKNLVNQKNATIAEHKRKEYIIGLIRNIFTIGENYQIGKGFA